jgi:hypothetical protein
MDETEQKKESRTLVASKGGTARAESLPADRRSEIARQGAASRWSQDAPRALVDGELEIAGRRIACAVLSTKLRVLTQETFLTAVGRAAKAKAGKGSARLTLVDGLPPFLASANLEPFVSDELRRAATPVVFRTVKGNKAYGYDAKLLPLVCEVYLLARDAHLKALQQADEQRKAGKPVDAKPVLLPTQEKIVQVCDLLMRGMAKDYIVNLVDRATGYHEQEMRDELVKILQQYIAPHLMPWTERFPLEFFKQVYRIHGWKWDASNKKHPQYVGHFINRYIYDQLPPGVLDKLQELNPITDAGYRKHQHHRHLADTGNLHLDRQITSTITVMQLSANKDEFKLNFWRVHGKAIEGAEPKRLVVQVKPLVDQPTLFPLDAFTSAPKKALVDALVRRT